MRKPVAFVCALLVIHVSLSGCATYKPVPKSEPEFQELSVGSRPTLRLTLHDGGEIELYEVTVQGDSLHGYLEPPPRVPPHSPTYGGVKLESVALDDVASIEVRKRSYTGLTMGAVAAAVILAVVYVVGMKPSGAAVTRVPYASP